MKLKIYNEYAKLIKVVLAPAPTEYLEQQKQLISILNKYNVHIIFTNKCAKAKYQMFTRDPFVVIDDKILLNYMKEDIRQLELDTFKKILAKIDISKQIFLPKDVIVEGGDIIVHNDIIFVGQNGNRTNAKGLEFIKHTFQHNHKIVPLFMINPDNNIPFVHLDCLFNPISSDTAIIYKEGFNQESLEEIKTIFPNLIFLNAKEQAELASNVISLGNKTVIVQKRHDRLIKKLVKNGFKVEVMSIYSTIKETGYNRCLTCPLERQD